jgi:hypothetical protein
MGLADSAGSSAAEAAETFPFGCVVVLPICSLYRAALTCAGDASRWLWPGLSGRR